MIDLFTMKFDIGSQNDTQLFKSLVMKVRITMTYITNAFADG